MKTSFFSLFSLLLLCFPSLNCGGGSSHSDNSSLISKDDSSETASYKVTFHATWSSESHSADFPSGAHFSPLVGATHNGSSHLWQIGQTPSPGIEEMAETGGTTLIGDEINALIDAGSAKKMIIGGGISLSPGITETTFSIDKNYNTVSLVSMIAPSPDWFVGVDGLSLIENGEFVNEMTVQLQPIDAGSDSGSNYTSANSDTNPKAPIQEIISSPFNNGSSVPPLGTFTFTRQ